VTGPFQPKLLRAYADETGDRGMGSSSSPFFAFACLLVPEEDDLAMRAVVAGLRTRLQVPKGSSLHWNRHVKTFSRRQHVTDQLLTLANIRVVYVVVDKSAIPASAMMRRDQAIFYNYAAGMILERVALAARDWPGGYRDAIVKFGHVKGFNHTSTVNYLGLRRSMPDWVPWQRIRSFQFDGMANWDGLQAADQYAGMLSAAMVPDPYGNYEANHFVRVCQTQLRRVGTTAWGRGFKFLGAAPTMHAYPWWNLTRI
jgi:hypothetical protein